jgi:hypothetical protein
MTTIDPAWLGCLAVLAVSAFLVLQPVRFFARKLALEEALSVCWVAWSIYMGAFVLYIGLKLPLGLSRNAHTPAVVAAVCISVVAILYLARITTDWSSLIRKSIYGLFGFTLVVVSVTLGLTLSRN